MEKSYGLYIAAAATTAIAGIMHLILALDSPKFGLNSDTLFLVGGIAQIFWAVPMLKRWSLGWYGIGIGGTAALIAIWVITRIPDNPITGRGGQISQNGMIVESMQVIFIAITIAIMIYEKRKKS